MTPERMEVARRLVACLRWVWLPGMNILDMATPKPRKVRIVSVGPRSIHGYGNHYQPDRRGVWSYIALDLDDDITRLGLLAVVRRAWGNPHLSTMWSVDGWYLTGVPDDQPALWFANGAPTEEAALLAALEAAQ